MRGAASRELLRRRHAPEADSVQAHAGFLQAEAIYTGTLVDIGWRDADARIEEIEEFIRSAEPLAAPVRAKPIRLRALAGAEA